MALPWNFLGLLIFTPELQVSVHGLICEHNSEIVIRYRKPLHHTSLIDLLFLKILFLTVAAPRLAFLRPFLSNPVMVT